MTDVAAVVLAAGASRRMGRNKMLMEMHGQSLVRRAVERAGAAGLEPLIVVIGHEPDEIRSELLGYPCTFAVNDAFTGPTSGSLHRGLEKVPRGVDAAMIILADMPLVTTGMMRALVDTLDTHDAPLAVSRYGDVLAPPLLFRRSLFGELLAWHGEGCGKQVVMRHRDEAVMLDWDAGALADVDTPEDFEAVVVSGP